MNEHAVAHFEAKLPPSICKIIHQQGRGRGYGYSVGSKWRYSGSAQNDQGHAVRCLTQGSVYGTVANTVFLRGCLPH